MPANLTDALEDLLLEVRQHNISSGRLQAMRRGGVRMRGQGLSDKPLFVPSGDATSTPPLSKQSSSSSSINLQVKDMGEHAAVDDDYGVTVKLNIDDLFCT